MKKKQGVVPASKIPDSILQRKGAIKTSLVPEQVRQLLNTGQISSVNLCEWLIVDSRQLVDSVFPQLGCESLSAKAHDGLLAIKSPTAMKNIRFVGELLSTGWNRKPEFEKKLAEFRSLPSDTARAWACMMIGRRVPATLADRFRWIQPFAADSNMSVRELAWLAMRPHIIENLEASFGILKSWTTDSDERLRRFASESTRPRGVWCEHITTLKQNPSKGLTLLEPLKADSSRYVRDSVGNWLNDASRSDPDFVRNVCSQWLSESDCPETRYIVRRALRTLEKAGKAKQRPVGSHPREQGVN